MDTLGYKILSEYDTISVLITSLFEHNCFLGQTCLGVCNPFLIPGHPITTIDRNSTRNIKNKQVEYPKTMM